MTSTPDRQRHPRGAAADDGAARPGGRPRAARLDAGRGADRGEHRVLRPDRQGKGLQAAADLGGLEHRRLRLRRLGRGRGGDQPGAVARVRRRGRPRPARADAALRLAGAGDGADLAADGERAGDRRNPDRVPRPGPDDGRVQGLGPDHRRGKTCHGKVYKV